MSAVKYFLNPSSLMGEAQGTAGLKGREWEEGPPPKGQSRLFPEAGFAS